MNTSLKDPSIQEDGLLQLDDRELVQKAKAGDPQAFRELFERHHQRVYALALGVVRNPDDAMDIIQEGFIKAHRYLPKFEGNSSFYTWLYRIVMNLSIDHLRKNKRAKHVEFDDAVNKMEGSGTGADETLLPKRFHHHPDKALVQKEVRSQINQALERLSENHRMVLVLREVEGLSYEEMATAMQCSKGTIMSRLFHARKNMQVALLELMGEKDLEAS